MTSPDGHQEETRLHLEMVGNRGGEWALRF
jgi:hypothetical protein